MLTEAQFEHLHVIKQLGNMQKDMYDLGYAMICH